jgi:hypothetical protein
METTKQTTNPVDPLAEEILQLFVMHGREPFEWTGMHVDRFPIIGYSNPEIGIGGLRVLAQEHFGCFRLTNDAIEYMKAMCDEDL